MILINLLPHREAARQKKREEFFAAVALAALVGVGVCVLVFTWYQAAISNQRGTNAALRSEIVILDQQIKDIKGLEAQIQALQARQRAVEDVQSDRNLAVHLLSEMVQQVPPGVVLTRVAQVDKSVLVTGTAQSNERVSEFLRNLGSRSAWFSKPELVETTAGTFAMPTKEQRKVFNFTLRASLVPNPEVDKVAPAPGKPASDGVPGQRPVAGGQS